MKDLRETLKRSVKADKGLPYFFEIADEIDAFKKENNIPESQRLTTEQLKIVDKRYLQQQQAFISNYEEKKDKLS